MAIAPPQSVKTVMQDKAYGHGITFNAKVMPQATMVWMDEKAMFVGAALGLVRSRLSSIPWR